MRIIYALRGVAVTGPAHLAAVADIPTAVEAGLPGALRTRLASEVVTAAATAEFDGYLLREQLKWAKVVKDSNVPQE